MTALLREDVVLVAGGPNIDVPSTLVAALSVDVVPTAGGVECVT